MSNNKIISKFMFYIHNCMNRKDNQINWIIYNPYKFVNLYFTLYRDLLNLIHLKIFWVEFWSIHVDGRQENGLHLIVSQFIGWCVGGNQHLENQSTESTERNFCSIIKVLIVLKKFKRNNIWFYQLFVLFQNMQLIGIKF